MRYAIYFVPEPASDLYRFGTNWLGRDARGGGLVAPVALDGVSAERIAAITAAPRRYGFHATLKPPFALAANRTIDDLEAALRAFARDCAAFEMPALRLDEIGGFLALVPSAPSLALTALAERAVRDFDGFRAPQPSAEQERRARAGLDARERELLEAWGYPYVLDRWRFHMTLTERLDTPERGHIRAVLEPHAAPVCRSPVRVDAVALFVEAAENEPLRNVSRFAFGRSA